MTRPIPCEARPSTAFRHLDGPCRCFVGGPAPEFGPVRGWNFGGSLGDAGDVKVAQIGSLGVESADLALIQADTLMIDGGQGAA